MEKLKYDTFWSLPSPDFRTKMSMVSVKGKAFLRCEVVVDASVEECAARSFMLMSRQRAHLNNSSFVQDRRTTYENDHCFTHLLVLNVGKGLRPRRFFTRHVWKRTNTIYASSIGASAPSPTSEGNNENRILIVHKTETEDTDTFFHYQVYARTTGFTSLTPCNDTNTATKLSFVIQLDLGGIVPHKLIELGAVDFLHEFVALRKLYNKDYKIDLAKRQQLISNELDLGPTTCTEADPVLLLFNSFLHMKVAKTPMPTRNEMNDALAFLLSVDSRSLMSEHDLVESEVTTRDKNSQVVRMQEIKILSDGSKVKSSITRQLSWWTDRDGIFLHSAPTKLSKIISKHRDAILPHVERGLVAHGDKS
ncbi:hypothetical protein ScalyP_jg11508 [Parmales sp. scaly parma]|nr:hypothetical protein ScalyP_jg11508 [Parmales sp. scaly parma]